MEAKTLHTKLILKLVLVVVAMFGFGFALVPLYDVFCDVTGINGKTSNVAAQQSEITDKQRLVTIEFMTHVRSDMPWKFEPKLKRIQVHPGESKRVIFTAHNFSTSDVIGQAIPSVSPGAGALYFSKIECFCFNSQFLTAGDSVEMALIFYIDPELPDNINTLTLSYTLYNITELVSQSG